MVEIAASTLLQHSREASVHSTNGFLKQWSTLRKQAAGTATLPSKLQVSNGTSVSAMCHSQADIAECRITIRKQCLGESHDMRIEPRLCLKNVLLMPMTQV